MEDNSYVRSVGEEPNNEAFVVKNIIRPQTKSLRQHQCSTLEPPTTPFENDFAFHAACDVPFVGSYTL